MKNTLLKIATVLVLGISIFSCSPEDGKDGIAGTAGTNGTNGTNSNVNVISTPWTIRTFTGSGSNWNVSYPLSQITQDNLDSGVLLTYKKTGTDIFQVSNTVTPYFWVYYSLGEIAMESSINQSGSYRHIIILRAGSAFERNVNTDYTKMSYQEICAKFNIPE